MFVDPVEFAAGNPPLFLGIVEYPLSGLTVSDPCAGPAASCPAPELLYDGFE